MNDTYEPASAQGAVVLPAQLLVWLSPSFPVGAYAYSHGLEAAASHGTVRNEHDLERWLAVLIGHGSIGNDMILLSITCRASQDRDWPCLMEAAALAIALQPSAERHLETTQQGASFMAAITAAWCNEAIETAHAAALRASANGREIAYPIAVAIAAAGHVLPLEATLEAYGIAAVGNLVSAAIRLGVLGQTGGQRVQARVLARIGAAARAAVAATPDDIANAAFVSDLASLQHETLSTRIFRS